MGRPHQKLNCVLEKTSFSFTYGIVFRYRIWCFFSLENISTLDNVPQGCCWSAFKCLIFLFGLYDYHEHGNLKFGRYENNPSYSAFQKRSQGVRGEIPPVGGWGILGVRNLTRRYFDYLNLFQSYNINNEHWLKSKLAWLECTKILKLFFGYWNGWEHFPPSPSKKKPDV